MSQQNFSCPRHHGQSEYLRLSIFFLKKKLYIFLLVLDNQNEVKEAAKSETPYISPYQKSENTKKLMVIILISVSSVFFYVNLFLFYFFFRNPNRLHFSC